MKRISLAIFALVLFGPPAEAQETLYPTGLAITAAQQANLTNIVATNNARTCLRVNAVGGEACTQAQACTAIGNPSNCASTASVARGLNVRIYPITLAGREEYVTFTFIVPQFVNALGDPTAFEYERVCANWQTLTNTQRNTACQALGRTASTVALPCRLCQ